MLTFDQIFQIPRKTVIAFVGGGGKTTTIFQLARKLMESGRSVIVTTTTHLAETQIAQADSHLICVRRRTRFADRWMKQLKGLPVITGPKDEATARFTGITAAQVVGLREYAGSDVILVEADGARLRPFKAPAAHEPVIPNCTNHVVAVVGVDAFGQPLLDASVHRPEQVAALTGIAPGSNIAVTPRLVADVMAHPQGGAKAVPPKARFTVLINKVESEERQMLAAECARHLLRSPHVDGVVLGALAHSLEVQHHRRAAVVVLAAGEGQRMGEDVVKPLLRWGHTTLLNRALRAAQTSQASHVMAVLGHAAEQIQATLPLGRIQTVVNPNWTSGMSTSVQAALQAMPDNIGGALFMLADQPLVEPDVLDALVTHWRQTGAPIVAPCVNGQRANPVLFARSMWPELQALSGDTGGRALVEQHIHRVAWLDWSQDITPDIDTPDDYHRLSGQT